MFESFEAAYLHTLSTVYAGKSVAPNGDYECFALGFSVEPQPPGGVSAHMFESINGHTFNMPFAQRYAQWILEGRSDPKELLDVNARAADFQDEAGRNAAYGPRLNKQLADCLEELQHQPGSRRATITILDADDQLIRQAKRETGSKTEYPCTIAYSFFIRNKTLHMHTTMRSNNVVSTICYDLYIACTLMHHVASQLGVSCGVYYHHMINAHILSKDIARASDILNQNGVVTGHHTG